MNCNEQNQLLRIKKLLKNNKIEQGLKFANQLIIQKYKVGYICKSINEFEDLLISLENENDLLLPSSETRNQFNVLNTMNDFMHYLDQSFFQKL